MMKTEEETYWPLVSSQHNMKHWQVLHTHDFALHAVESRPEDQGVGRPLAQQVVALRGLPSWGDFDGLNTAAAAFAQWHPLIFLWVLIEIHNI